MWADPRWRRHRGQIPATVDAQLTRPTARSNRVDENDDVTITEIGDQAQSWCTGIDQLNGGGKFPAGAQQFNDVRAEAIIAQQHVTEPDDGNWRREARVHRTFTVAIVRPSTSSVWQAHAMHGSKECTVRRISSGFSGLAIGVFSSAASYGPGASPSSRGLA